MDPGHEIIAEIAAKGIIPPASIILDGKIHRWSTSGRANDKAGWYIAYGDGIPCAVFGDWRTGETHKWAGRPSSDMTIEERNAMALQFKKAATAREEARAETEKITMSAVADIWESAPPAPNNHPYLEAKKIVPGIARMTGDGRLIIPMYDGGIVSSLQYIGADGEKKFQSGVSVAGKFTVIGHEQSEIIYIAEGFATASTIAMVTGAWCVCAFSASNIPTVVGILKDHALRSKLIVVADNDSHGIGLKYAEQSKREHGVDYVIPNVLGDANDYHNSGSDLHELLGVQKHWLIHVDKFCEKPEPIKWLVKSWVQSNAMIMLHGASGACKTFVAIDFALRIASGHGQWAEKKITKGEVVYLAGEGHHGLRLRIAAWRKANNYHGEISLWLSPSGVDLDTPEGLKKVIESIKYTGIKPALVVVDTLHRFLSGDENSAKDAKTMIDACNVIMVSFFCSVLLVHHTGVGIDAKTRARGSSAWKAALDIEIHVSKQDDEIKITQQKAKDFDLAAPITMALESIPLDGWLDDDGEIINGAVLKQQAPTAPPPESKTVVLFKQFERAWWHSGSDMINGMPYVSKSAMINFLIENDGIKPTTAKMYVEPSRQDKLIGYLLNGGIIKAVDHGWIVINELYKAKLSIKLGG